MPSKEEKEFINKWFAEHADAGIPPVIDDEIGTEVEIGETEHRRKIPIVSLILNLICPRNNPHPTSQDRRPTLQPWIGQGDLVDDAALERPTEDKALDHIEP